MSDDYISDIMETLGTPSKKPRRWAGKNAQMRGKAFIEGWNRWKDYGPADLQAIKAVLEEDVENARHWVNLYQRSGKEEDANRWARKGAIGGQLIDALEALIRHHATFGTYPSAWEDLDHTTREAAQRAPKARGTRGSILAAVREVLEQGDYPTTKVGFYTEVDKRRVGVKEGSRASERWLRDNWEGGLPDPKEWPDLLA